MAEYKHTQPGVLIRLIIGGVLIHIYRIYWIDPIITLLICIYIIREAFVILKESVNILMQSTPDHLDLGRVKRTVEKIPQVNHMHHLHAWMLTDNQVHLEGHVELLKDMKLSEVHQVQKEIEEVLRKDFRVHHVTIQFEYQSNHSPTLIHQDTG